MNKYKDELPLKCRNTVLMPLIREVNLEIENGNQKGTEHLEGRETQGEALNAGASGGNGDFSADLYCLQSSEGNLARKFLLPTSKKCPQSARDGKPSL